VVVVQIMGSWCPNCMDETNFLAPWYDKNKSRGVEDRGAVVREKCRPWKPRAEAGRMKKRMNVGYDVLLAGFHTTDSVAASLPMIEKVLAFPTTIFIDKQGKVRRIHTGFSGPGHGQVLRRDSWRSFNHSWTSSWPKGPVRKAVSRQRRERCYLFCRKYLILAVKRVVATPCPRCWP
jgi:thiol-disulfide isomerase/thioredoxin